MSTRTSSLVAETKAEVKSGEKLKYFDFKAAWDTLFVPVLSHPKALAAKKLFMLCLLKQNLKKDSPGEKARMAGSPCDVKFPLPSKIKETLEGLPSDEKRLIEMNKHPMCTFSVVLDNPYDMENYALFSDEAFADANKLEHYMAIHACRPIAALVWTWCSLVCPERKWQIVDIGPHAFVMDATDSSTLYDIS